MGDDATQAFARALQQQSKNVIYPDYKTKEDFSLWLTGFREKIRNAFHYTPAQEDLVNAEVVRSISGKLQCGAALDTYNRLEAAVKADYEQLIPKLTEEFLDPQEKMKFIENFSYNKRRKGQSIKEFMQEIIKDMNRYSGMPDNVMVGGASVPNQTKIKEEVRRFKRGIRDVNGEKNRELSVHMKFHLHNDDDLTWEKALEAASRWEAANYKDDESGSSSSGSSDEGEKVAAATKGRARRKSGKMVLTTVMREEEVASLAEQVEANTLDIREIKSEQERMSTELNTGFASLLQEIRNISQTSDDQQYYNYNYNNRIDNEEC